MSRPALIAAIIAAIIVWLGQAGEASEQGKQPPLPYVLQDTDSTSRKEAPAVFNRTMISDAGGQGNYGFYALVHNAGTHFKALPPFGGHPCGVRTKTHITAEKSACQYATNGGPFNMENGNCSGVLISDGVVLSGDFTTSSALFGVTAGGDKWVLGDITKEEAETLNVSQALSGFTWLVRDGKNLIPVNEGEVAPRTAIGTDRDGHLIMLQVDGCEKCSKGDQGQTTYETAQLLVSLGTLHAINLDGGGSSTTAVNGSVINRPTCIDTWEPVCERGVATVACVV